ncbi:unnamed protein product [Ostreobium quekettii]|uniref:Uncharacterized protein n=1 Tax=Ostreobium quekettii TaxID=121088 RepID=A0A8S1J0Q3_9CHLO|nr:unnamed protein product [Ostreobium quekettii]|eukprot:evm.model.scf_3711.2 EVM.evm.TU.scf_3711.2   scf_3711:6130-9603(-)
MEIVQVYVDEDEEEEFYACKWSINESIGSPLLLLAGKKGVLRILDCKEEKLVETMTAHGHCINDIAVFPSRPHLALTASKDESLRLWNIATKTCVLIVAGEGGHTAEVLAADCHLNGEQFLSCGMDNCVKIWSLKAYEDAIQKSTSWSRKNQNFPTKYSYYPMFSSTWIHGNYVDCVRWYGDLILSKSVDNRIVLWKPEELPENGWETSCKFVILMEFHLQAADIWFIRFSLDFKYKVLACGNRAGKIYTWDMEAAPEQLQLKLVHKDCKSVVRQTAVSFDGSVIVASCEDGTIWRWDKEPSKMRG